MTVAPATTVARRDDRGPRDEARDDRTSTVGPVIPEDITASDLDKDVRAELLGLNRPVAEIVARHLVATGRMIDDDPDEALAHALAARRLASRIAAVREAVGLAAYHAGEWQTAIGELRTYHRMSGRQDHLAVLADCERALGRPERAIDLYRGADRAAMAPGDAVELLIVAAGARGDLGQKDAAVAMLQVRELTSGSEEAWAARLRYAYADALLAADRRDEAREWFARAAEVDQDNETDAAERLLELDGVTIEGDEQDEDDDADTADAAPRRRRRRRRGRRGRRRRRLMRRREDEDDDDDLEDEVELDSEGQADDDAAVDAEIDEDEDDDEDGRPPGRHRRRRRPARPDRDRRAAAGDRGR